MRNSILIFLVVFLSSCYRIPSIYNEGTAWRLPRDLKVSDFYYDTATAIQYDGRVQQYFLKVQSFFWQDEENPNYTIESAFFIVKCGDDYGFTFRRYITLAGEEPKSDNVRALWARWEGAAEVVRGSTLRLSNSEDGLFSFGWMRRERWSLIDGYFDNPEFIMYQEKHRGPIIEQILHSAEMFVFSFPSLDTEINPFELEPGEITLLKNHGIFPELENNCFALSSEELESLRHNLVALIAQEKMSPRKYFKHVKNHQLR